MSDVKQMRGACLCGGVKVEAKAAATELGVCHCETCRKWSAGPFFALDCGTDVSVSGESVGIYSSSDWAERGFCKTCGSTLFYRLKEMGKYIVSSEIFGEEALQFDHQIFIDEKPAYYDFTNKTKNMTGAEIFAMFQKCEGV